MSRLKLRQYSHIRASESGCTVPGNSSQFAANSGTHREIKKGRALRQGGEGEKTAKSVK